jgi:hypothetical protein
MILAGQQDSFALRFLGAQTAGCVWRLRVKISVGCWK